MRPPNFLLAIVIGSFSIQCCRDSENDNPIVLCDYVNKTVGSALQYPCATDAFVVHLSGLNGKVEFSQALNAYVVGTGVSGTYDCQILGFLCGSYEHLNGKFIHYSSSFYEYNGAVQLPLLPGQELFVLKNLEYSVK